MPNARDQAGNRQIAYRFGSFGLRLQKHNTMSKMNLSREKVNPGK
jgi:hypothetical protein